MPETWLGWHFLAENRRLRGGSHEVVRTGATLNFDGRPKIHVQGFHASQLAIDALVYAPGPIIERVELGGTIVTGTDIAVAQTRKTLWMVNATDLLHEFALDVAEAVLRNDSRGLESIEIKRKWLLGNATNDELRTAKFAALDAVRGAVSVTERMIAWATTWTNASDSAGALARFTYNDPARATYNTMLEDRLWKLVPA